MRTITIFLGQWQQEWLKLLGSNETEKHQSFLGTSKNELVLHVIGGCLEGQSPPQQVEIWQTQLRFMDQAPYAPSTFMAYIYIIYIPGTQMTLIFVGKGLVLEG